MTVDEFHELFGADGHSESFVLMCEWIAEHIGEKTYTRTIRIREGQADFETIVIAEDGHVAVTPDGDEPLTRWVTVPSHRPPPFWKRP